MSSITNFATNFRNIVESNLRTVTSQNSKDYVVGFGSAFVITAFKLGNLNLLASAAAYATYNRVDSIITSNVTSGFKSLNQNQKANVKLISIVFAAAVYAGVSSLSLPYSLLTVGGMYLTEHFLRSSFNSTPSLIQVAGI